MASRSARSLVILATVFRAVVAFGPAFAATGASFALSLLTRGFLATTLFVVGAATGAAGAAALVVAARALVVLVVGTGTLGAIFVRDEALVGPVVLEVIVESQERI